MKDEGIDVSKATVAVCFECGEDLYTLQKNIAEIAGSVSSPSDFLPIGLQPMNEDGQAPKLCVHCGGKWLFAQIAGRVYMNTDCGLISFS